MKSAGAVVAGYLAWATLFLAGNWMLSRASPASFGPDGSTTSGMLSVILGLSVVSSIASGWIAALISRSFGACVALGVALSVVGLFVQLRFWELMPVWYHVSFLVLLLPGVLLGHRISAVGP